MPWKVTLYYTFAPSRRISSTPSLWFFADPFDSRPVPLYPALLSSLRVFHLFFPLFFLPSTEQSTTLVNLSFSFHNISYPAVVSSLLILRLEPSRWLFSQSTLFSLFFFMITFQNTQLYWLFKDNLSKFLVYTLASQTNRRVSNKRLFERTFHRTRKVTKCSV